MSTSVCGSIRTSLNLVKDLTIKVGCYRTWSTRLDDPQRVMFMTRWHGAQGNLKVYRAVDFPLKWQLEKVCWKQGALRISDPCRSRESVAEPVASLHFARQFSSCGSVQDSQSGPRTNGLACRL